MIPEIPLGTNKLRLAGQLLGEIFGLDSGAMIHLLEALHELKNPDKTFDPEGPFE